MAKYQQKLEIIDAVLYDNTVTMNQATAFLAGTTWAKLGYSIHPQTRTVTITFVTGEVLVVPLGSMIVKRANGAVFAMTPEAFAVLWEAV